MGDRNYRQQNISLREEDVVEWEALRAVGWKPTEIWRLGIGTAKTATRGTQINAADNCEDFKAVDEDGLTK